MDVKQLRQISTESAPAVALNTSSVYNFRDFRPITGYISQTIQDSATVRRTMKCY